MSHKTEGLIISENDFTSNDEKSQAFFHHLCLDFKEKIAKIQQLMKPYELLFTPEEKFREAFEYCLKKQGRGSLTRLAESLGKSPSQLADIKAGRRPGDEKLKQKIAEYFGYTYEDFLKLGARLLLEKNKDKFTEPFLGYLEILSLPPSERFYKILSLLTQEFQISPALFYTPHPAELEEKLKTEEGIIEVYYELRKKLEKAKAILEKHRHELE